MVAVVRQQAAYKVVQPTKSKALITMPPLFATLILSAIVASVQAQPETPKSSTIISLDSQSWLLAIDPTNSGRKQSWWTEPIADAKATKVPGIIQETFPAYHGVVWYWCEFNPSVNPHSNGRYLLRFWQVDYLADIWLNDVHVGQHEGVGQPFVLDVTDTIKPQTVNRLAVRILNPINEPIDGIKLNEIPHSSKAVPWAPNWCANWGGITDSVELLVAPAVRLESLYVRPDVNSRQIQVQVNVSNTGKKAVKGRSLVCVAPASAGETLCAAEVEHELPPGDTLVHTSLKVEKPKLWELSDPYLYRVTVRTTADGSESFDEQSTRCGFRDISFQNGYFRLNGRRVFLKGAFTSSDVPISTIAPSDPDLLRKDLLNAKAVGFNFVRFFTGFAPRYQYELCDELGLLVYRENYATWLMAPSPKLPERFNRTLLAAVKRDRNHPCVAMWGLLNETLNDPIFEQGQAALPLVRSLDETRILMLNSGGNDGTGKSIANVGSQEWESSLADLHPYQTLPHNAQVIHNLRSLSRGDKPVFVSEYGMTGTVDFARMTRLYEQWGRPTCEDAIYYRKSLEQFMVDWQRWNMNDTFANPEDYFRQGVAWSAGMRKLGINAIRSNPNIIGVSVTMLNDPSLTSAGMIGNFFRELKPGIVDALSDSYSSLRWSLFVEPVHVYRGRKARFEAVLSNEDKLAPGEYPVRLQVVGPHNTVAMDRTITVNISDSQGQQELPFALPVFAEDVVVEGPSGKYRFLANFQKSAAATGGEVEFYVTDPKEMPKIEREIVLWGDDPDLHKWLSTQGIKTRAFAASSQTSRDVVLVGNRPAIGETEAFRGLAEHIARGSHAIFLSPDVFQQGDNRTRWLPVVNKGRREDNNYDWEHWSKNHPIFAGLQAGCILDHTLYREVMSNNSLWSGQELPAEVVAGAMQTGGGYRSGLSIAVYNWGAGRFTLNTLRIRENLGSDPVAERLLRNMICHAAVDTALSPADLPPDFDQQLKTIGY